MSSGQLSKKMRVDSCGVIEIAPEGDLILCVGLGDDEEPALRLRVSREILKVSSPVFKAMLGKRFRERDATVVRLPDDDVTATQHLCQLLHHQANDLSGLQGKSLCDLALMADKYQCADKCQLFFRNIMNRGLDMTELPMTREGWIPDLKLSICDMIAISFVCGDHEMFWKSTRAAIELTSVDKRGNTQNSIHLFAIVPEKIISEISQHREIQTQRLTIMSHNILMQIGSKRSTKTENCKSGTSRVLDYMKYLHQTRVWSSLPKTLPLKDCQLNIVGIADRMKAESATAKCSEKQPCDLCKVDWSREVKDLAAKAGSILNYAMCLVCVKNGVFETCRKCDRHGLPISLQGRGR